MDNSETTKKSSFELDKEQMRSWLDFIPKINQLKEQEAEEKLRKIEEKLIEISSTGFFSKDNFLEENEKFFISSFSPSFIRKISLENITNKYIKEILRTILQIYIDEFIKNLENHNFLEIWESLVDTFRDEKLLNRSNLIDCADKFIEINYNLINPNAHLWRNKLQNDDTIDYLQRDFDDKFIKDRVGVANWTRAKITEIELNKNARIKIIGTGHIEQVSLVSADVLPFKTLSKDYEWRESLKKGDEIDYLDSKSWYRSTVIDVEERSRGSNKYKFIKYGLRIYRQKGKANDSKGNNYFGWNENFDKFVNVHDPRIRYPNQHSKTIENYDIITTYPLDSKLFNDLETHIPFEINETKFFAIPRKNENRKLDILYINAINYFFRNNGGQKLINTITSKDKISLDIFSSIVDLVDNIHSYLHYYFAKTFLKEFRICCFDFLLDFGISDVRNFKKEKIDTIIKKLKNLLLKVYMESDVNALFDVFTIDFGINCLTSVNLEKKLLGLKILSTSLLETMRINSNQYISSSFNDKHVSSQDLLLKLREKNIIDQIFGSSTHVQIIQKSSDLLKCLLMGNFLSSNDLMKIWGLSYSYDIEMRNSIYKLLQSNFYHFSVTLAEFLILKVLDTKSESINTLDLDLIGQIYRALNSEKQLEISNKISHSFITMIFSGKLNNENTENVINELINLLKNYDMQELRLKVIEQLLQIFVSGIHFIKVLKIIRRLISSINLNNDDIHRNKFMKLIIEEYSIISIIEKSLITYHEFIFKKIEETTYNEDIPIVIFSEEFTHRDLVIELFSFLGIIICHYNYAMFDNDFINTFYYIFVEKPINSNNSNLFFKWLREADDKKLIPPDNYQKIFSKMVNSENLIFTNINIELLNTIWNIFITINKNLNKLINEKGDAAYSNSNDKALDIKVLCDPFLLEGFELIWKLVISSPTGDIGKKAIQNFLKLFLCNNYNAESRGKVWNSIISKCIETIRLLKSLKNTKVSNTINKEMDLKIQNILLVLQGLIEETEKKGTAGVISHSSILKSRKIVLNITNDIRSRFIIHEMEQSFTLTVYANLTIWDLKILLAKRLNIIPEIIRLTLGTIVTGQFFNQNNHNSQSNNNNFKVITENDHGKTLSELKLNNNDKITLNKSDVIENIPKCNLLSNGELSTKAKYVFKQIFGNYSENGKMGRLECAKFATKAIGGSNTIPLTDIKVINMFNLYDKNKNDFIELEGFNQFFLDALEKNKSHVVWENLSCFNYRNDLKNFLEPIDDYNIDKQIMPRYIIAKNQEYFEEIFRLQDEENSTAKEASKFLSHICTNPNIYKNILTLNNITRDKKVDDYDVWEEYLSTKNDYKLLYSLQIVESFFEEFELGSSKVDCEPIEMSILEESNDMNLLLSVNRINWIEIFLSRGGLLHILKVISNPYNQNKLSKKCIVLAIKIIRNCLSILFRTNIENKKDDTIMILRKESSNFNVEDMIDSSKAMAPSNDEIISIEKNQLENELISNLILKYGNSLLKEINFDLICTKLMEILYELCQKSQAEQDDKLFAHSVFSLFNLIIISHENPSNLLDNIYSQKLFNNTISFEEFIINGCLSCKNVNILNTFCKNLRSLIVNLKKYGEYSLIQFLLNLFKEKCLLFQFLEKIDEKINFFNLFTFLINSSINENQTKNSIDYCEFCINLIDLLNQFTPNDIINEDILIGYLKIINSILSQFKSLKIQIGFEMKFIQKLLQLYTFKEYKTPHLETIKSRCLAEEEKIKFFVIDAEKIPQKHKIYTSSDLRQTIFNLILNLTTELINLSLLFESEFSDIPNHFSRITKKSYNPHEEKKSSFNYVGIKNLGCICYMNSMIQQFFNIPSFRYCLLQINDNIEPNYLDQKMNVDDNVLHQLQKMFAFLELSERQDYNPHEFCHAFKDMNGQPTNLTIQQDSQEFLNRLFDVLERKIQSTQFKYLLDSVFGGKTCSQLVCSGGCGSIKNTIEAFYNLSLEVKNMKSLKDSLDKYISEETISGYKCEVCKKNVTITKRNSLAELPNLFIVHLQRIVFNYDTFRNDKVNSRLDFPKHLNLKSYTSEEICKSKNEESKDYNSDSKNEESFLFYSKDDSYYEYELVGVVVHTGTADAGHYYSYINVKREGMEDQMVYDKTNLNDVNKWLEFNDTLIRGFNINNLEEECFGGAHQNMNSYTEVEETNNNNWEAKPVQYEEKDNIKNAYMLVYERKKKKPIKLVLDPKIDETIMKNKNLIKFNKLNKYSINKSFDIFNPELISEEEFYNKRIYQNIYFDEDLEEHFYYKMFYGVNKYIPQTYFLDVYLDNINFYNDQKIFHKDFNDFLNGILDNVINLINKNEIQEEVTFKVFEICFKFVIELFSRSYFKENFNKIIDKLCNIVQIFPKYSQYIIDQLLLNKSKLTEFLFSSDESSNSSFKDLILLSINNNFDSNNLSELTEEIEKISPIDDSNNISKTSIPVIQLLDHFISWFPKETSKNWTKFAFFLELIDKFSSSGELQLEYMFKKEMIFVLIDFFLVKDSPFFKTSDNRVEMGNNIITPKFAPLISTISTMISRCYTPSWDEDSLNNKINPETYKGGKIYKLSDKSRDCIMSKHFYIKSLKGGFDAIATGTIISHLMFNNLNFTRKILYYVCEVFNESLMLCDIKHNLDIFYEILRINDKYSKLRLEWSLGIPQVQVKYNGASSIPSIYKSIGKFSDKIVLYPSPLLEGSNHDSIIDQVIRYTSHSELLAIIYYFFLLAFKLPTVLNYLDNLPSPLNEYKKLIYFFEEIIKEELSGKSNFTSLKSNETIISFLKNLRHFYEEKKAEIISSEENLYMRANFSLNKITKEFIIFLPFENLKSKNVHLINLELETEISRIIDVENGDNEKIQKVLDTFPKKNDVIDENLEKNSNDDTRKYINLYQYTKVTEDKLNKKMNIHDFDNVTNVGYAKGEEEFYRKIANNSISGYNLFRNLSNLEFKENESSKALKKLILVNNSDEDYRVKIFFRLKNLENQNNYVPNSEIIIKLKKYSVNKCFTFIKQQYDKPWSDIEISTQIETFNSHHNNEISHNFNIFDEEIIGKNIAQHEISKVNQIPALPSPNDEYNAGAQYGMASLSDDIFVDCPHCLVPNQINSNSNVFNCSKCNRTLFD